MALTDISVSLKAKLTILFAGTIFLVVGGLTLIHLAFSLSEIQANVRKDGVIVAQVLAPLSAGLLEEGGDRQRFGNILDHAAERVDLLSFGVVDGHTGLFVAHSHPELVGTPFTGERGALGTGGRGEIFRRIVRGASLDRFIVTAPILMGTRQVGVVELAYRDPSVINLVWRSVAMAVAVAAAFTIPGALFATLFVRRIVGPVGELAEAALRLEEGHTQIRTEARFPDEVTLLQQRFNHLAGSLTNERDRNTALSEELREFNRRLERRVREATGEITAIHQSLKDGLLTLDRDGVIRQASPAAQDLFGRDVEGQPLTALFGAKMVIDAALRDVIRNASTPEIRCVGAGAGKRPFLVTLSPLRAEEEEEVTGVVATVKDMTEIERLEEIIQRSDRLASLGTLSAGLAHELNNCMNVIQGYCRVIERDLPEESEVRGDIGVIRDENARAIQLLRTFLRFARPANLEVVPTTLEDVVERALEVLAVEIERRGIEVRRRFEGGGPEIPLDPVQVQQAAMNVILNALQASTEGGALEVEIEERPTEVALRIRDEGTGIPAGIRDRIFDPFFSTKEEGEGTGLGLAVTHRIVEDHKGRIEVRSDSGGTEMTLIFPKGG